MTATCRVYGHGWKEEEVKYDGGEYAVVAVLCDVCGTKRIDIVHRPSGIVVRRKYSYADGYLTKKPGRVPRSVFRKELYG
ncbi:hypothetical protein SEA_FRIBS8_59 [Gordonia phage Fribs8]|nr:hypothetical protein SEA_NIBBLES_58 [Gordonia phage Nibbles]WNN95787.1 hypothetical protein SEA_FRIBS8_59 [Gordonia phage Fribs8]